MSTRPKLAMPAPPRTLANRLREVAEGVVWAIDRLAEGIVCVFVFVMLTVLLTAFLSVLAGPSLGVFAVAVLVVAAIFWTAYR